MDEKQAAKNATATAAARASSRTGHGLAACAEQHYRLCQSRDKDCFEPAMLECKGVPAVLAKAVAVALPGPGPQPRDTEGEESVAPALGTLRLS